MKEQYYHIHEAGYMDDFWTIGNEFIIDNNYIGLLFEKIEETLKELDEKQKCENIDAMIAALKKEIENESMDGLRCMHLRELLYNTYIIRREQALEAGRKIYAPSTPSRAHSLFVTNKRNLSYWQRKLGTTGNVIFKLELHGEFFVTSVKFFPNKNLSLEQQIEKSKNYWKPKVKRLLPQQEILFQGKGTIIE